MEDELYEEAEKEFSSFIVTVTYHVIPKEISKETLLQYIHDFWDVVWGVLGGKIFKKRYHGQQFLSLEIFKKGATKEENIYWRW